MTPVRPKRYRGAIHATADLRLTLCSRKVDGWIVEPDTAVTCSRCLEVEADIARGN